MQCLKCGCQIEPDCERVAWKDGSVEHRSDRDCLTALKKHKQQHESVASEFVGPSHFVIYPGDVGTEAYRDEYVQRLTARLAAAEAELECERARRIAAESNHEALLKANERLEADVEELRKERDAAREELELLRTFIQHHSHSHGLRMDGTSVWWMRGMVGTGRDVFEAIEAKGGRDE